MKAAGVRGNPDAFVELRAMGIDPAFVERARKAGHKVADPDDLVELRALGRVESPSPPRPPRAAVPSAPPPDWDPPGSDNDD
jgi:hypothetical protein